MTKLIVFILALISGAITRSGMMTIENMILMSWDSTSHYLLYVLAPDLHLYILFIGILVIIIAAYFLFEPFIRGLEHSGEGVVIAIFGFIIGYGVMHVILNYVDVVLGLPS